MRCGPLRLKSINKLFTGNGRAAFVKTLHNVSLGKKLLPADALTRSAGQRTLMSEEKETPNPTLGRKYQTSQTSFNGLNIINSQAAILCSAKYVKMNRRSLIMASRYLRNFAPILNHLKLMLKRQSCSISYSSMLSK